MKAIEKIERFQEIDRIIKTKKTGAPEKFAEKIGISKRQLFKDFEEIRMLGVRISYCRSRETYFYENGYEFEVEFDIKKKKLTDQAS